MPWLTSRATLVIRCVFFFPPYILYTHTQYPDYFFFLNGPTVGTFRLPSFRLLVICLLYLRIFACIVPVPTCFLFFWLSTWGGDAFLFSSWRHFRFQHIHFLHNRCIQYPDLSLHSTRFHFGAPTGKAKRILYRVHNAAAIYDWMEFDPIWYIC